MARKPINTIFVARYFKALLKNVFMFSLMSYPVTY